MVAMSRRCHGGLTDVLFTIVLLVLILSAVCVYADEAKASACTSSSYEIWVADPLQKVFPDSRPTSEASGDRIHHNDGDGNRHITSKSWSTTLHAAAGEITSLQVVVSPLVAAHVVPSDMDISVAAPKGVTVNVFQVLNVNVTFPQNAAKRVGPFPDGLGPIEQSLRLPTSAGENLVFWVTFEAEGALVGKELETVLTIPLPASTSPCVLSVTLATWSFTLPNAAASEQLIDSAIQTRSISHLTKHDATFEQLQAFYDNMIDHRVNCIAWAPVEPALTINHDGTLNSTDHDRMVEHVVSRGIRYLHFPMPNFVHPSHMFATNTTWCGNPAYGCVPVLDCVGSVCKDLNSDFVSNFTTIMTSIRDHYKALGVLNSSFVMLIDEPNYGDAVTLQLWVQLADLIRGLGLRLIQTTFPIPEVDAVTARVDWFVAHIVQYSDMTAARQMAELAAKGTRISLYHNGVPITDLSGLRLRSLPWMIAATNLVWQLPGPGLDGTLAWYSVDSWRDDPYMDADQYCVAPGSSRCAAGWGYLLLPRVDRSGVLYAEPVSTIRWQEFMEGVQDAEVLYWLNRQAKMLTTKCGCTPFPAESDTSSNGGGSSVVIAVRDSRVSSCCDAVSFAKRSIQRIHDVAWSWYPVTDYTETTYTTNVTLFNEVREQVGQAANNVVPFLTAMSPRPSQ